VQVLHEIKRGSDALADWAQAHEEMFRPVDKAVMLIVKQVLGEYPGLAKRSDKNDADAFIIGLAVSVMKPAQRSLMPSKAVVVTEEKLKGNTYDNPLPWLGLIVPYHFCSMPEWMAGSL